MPISRLCTLLAMGSLLVLSLTDVAEAQWVRRFAGGGVQINAPFVRVNVGPGGATSVRAPFTAVDSPGRVYVGRRRRLLVQPRYAAPPRNMASQNVAPHPQRPAQHSANQPTPVHVDALPYPTASQLARMEKDVLVETLRKMMARLHHRLSLLNTGEGWQSYLVLSREILGSPGAPPEAVQFEAIQKILPRYHSVMGDSQYVKVSALPSFVATFAALQETNRRFSELQPEGPLIAGSKKRHRSEKRRGRTGGNSNCRNSIC